MGFVWLVCLGVAWMIVKNLILFYFFQKELVILVRYLE